MSEAAQARSHALERQLQLRAPQPQPPPPPQAQLAQLACAYAAEGRATGSSTSNAASPPLFLSAGGSDTHALQHGAGCGAASWSEQESSPPAGCILPLERPGDER